VWARCLWGRDTHGRNKRIAIECDTTAWLDIAILAWTRGSKFSARPVAIPAEGPELRGAPRPGLFRGAGRGEGADHESGRVRRAGIALAIESKVGREPCAGH
jgi:hypothetical protein